MLNFAWEKLISCHQELALKVMDIAAIEPTQDGELGNAVVEAVTTFVLILKQHFGRTQ